MKDPRYQVCLTCTMPPDRCDTAGKGRPCPYAQQFRSDNPAPVLIQHYAGRKEPPPEKYGH